MTKVLIGLTGSIGMGKTTAAGMFRDLGCDVWDADAAVHRLYSKSGAAVNPIGRLFPDAVIDGAVDRGVLKNHISADKTALSKIESIVHPLVQQDRDAFKSNASSDIVVFDIPLLFETQAQDEFDMVVAVYVDEQIQQERVLARPGASQDHFNLIKSKQMPAADKVALSDYVIPTDTLASAQTAVKNIVSAIRSNHA